MLKRTHRCGSLTSADAGREVVLCGWVNQCRDHGGCQFVDLRDREGMTQIVFDPEIAKEAHEASHHLRHEWVIAVKGKVVSRGGNVNAKIATGEIEVRVTALEILNKAKNPPFEIRDDVATSEEKRLEHRYLDLRRPALQHNFMLRHKLYQAVRRTLDELGFLEFETPYMVKYTPGGARNFLVPSRLNPGHFYALAESPQIFKQLLMVAGYDRYFQICRCFRDEDLRLDRQPEFSQIDIEMSFVDQEDVFAAVEKVSAAIFKACKGIDIQTPFPRMPYDEAMRRFGVDKPDTRFGLELTDLTQMLKAQAGGGVPLFAQVIETHGIIKGLRVPGKHEISRAEGDKLEEAAKQLGAKGLARAKVGEGGSWTQSPLSKSISDNARLAINQALGAETGDLIFFQMGHPKLVNAILAALRMTLGKRFDLIPANRFDMLWVVDFPLFEFSEENNAWVAAHHPFTSPREEDVAKLQSDPGSCKALAYDLVMNGNEVGGGSIRIHQAEVQAKVFAALGLDPAKMREKFGFLLEAFEYGAPPHAGLALGLDRWVMLLTGAQSLREVVAFPKTQRGQDLMTGAPTAVDDKQLAELFVKTALVAKT